MSKRLISTAAIALCLLSTFDAHAALGDQGGGVISDTGSRVASPQPADPASIHSFAASGIDSSGSMNWRIARAESDDADDAKMDAKFKSPVLTWGLKTQKDPLTDEATTKPQALKFVLTEPSYVVTVSASCGKNGVSIFFIANAGTGKPEPQYAWYVDNSDNSGDQVADVRMRVDGRSVHVAQGYPEEKGHTQYTNSLGLLFYEPNLVAHVAQDQSDSANTGILGFDRFMAPMVKQAANANAQKWADSSAGPLSDLVNARSIRVELPLTNMGAAPVLDLNPQDKVLHKFVKDCAARFDARS